MTTEQPAAPCSTPPDPNERMPLLRAVGRAVVRLLPRNELLFRLARRIVDRHNADNDFDMQTNGELWFARTLVPRSRVIFDVGANQGDWAVIAHQLNPQAHIHCFEPSPVTFRLLERNAALPNLTLNRFGLSDKHEERDLWIYDDGSGANSLYHRVGTIGVQTRTESVAMRSLDAYCSDHAIDRIDFMKIDVEGHEVSVFRGGERMFRESRVAAVQFEYNDTYIDARTQLKDIWEFFRGLGRDYQFYKIYPTELRHVPEYTQRYESFRYSNWAVLHKETASSLKLPV
jgi:FkbM family methyltransferase